MKKLYIYNWIIQYPEFPLILGIIRLSAINIEIMIIMYL